MRTNLTIYKDNSGFRQSGYQRTLIVEDLEALGYETLAIVTGFYETSEVFNVTAGDVLEAGDPRGKTFLKIRDTFTGEIMWADITKEKFNELKITNDQQMISVVVNNNFGGGNIPGVTGKRYNDAWLGTSEEGITSIALEGIGQCQDLKIEIAGETLAEHKGFDVPFDPGDMPVGLTYKVDKANDILHVGPEAKWFKDTRLLISSEKKLTLIP